MIPFALRESDSAPYLVKLQEKIGMNHNPSVNGGPFLFQEAGLESLRDCQANYVQLVQVRTVSIVMSLYLAIGLVIFNTTYKFDMNSIRN